ncbi:PREDICTED: 28 kDa heat- and acid-stable phosphoprotein [Pseudopodoces humilis]|uniref:28 kDa heat- and acid-stable phosphoprotein n=1 Tax=Pseudopodoces humilis TaxID=181119 RepID=UPI0006B6C514|nr:PREDICTED: 28 kDa heat- and acid-stable phosphoprotein [Pseudopodoces humilis]
MFKGGGGRAGPGRGSPRGERRRGDTGDREEGAEGCRGSAATPGGVRTSRGTGLGSMCSRWNGNRGRFPRDGVWGSRSPGECTGRKGGHKGRARQYTSPEEIDAQLQAEKQKAREEEEQEEGGEGATGDPKKEKKSLDSDESDEDDEDYQQKRKGVEGLIDIENPNRVIQTTKKVTQLDLDGPKELSRREREEIEKQKAKERYMKMHLAGKTEQAKADLARLAIIRKQREEAARKKEEERKAKDEAAMAGKRLQSLSLNK